MNKYKIYIARDENKSDEDCPKPDKIHLFYNSPEPENGIFKNSRKIAEI